MKKFKFRPFGLDIIVSTYADMMSEEPNDFIRGITYGIRLTFGALFGWTIDYDNDSVIRIRNRKGKVIYEEV